MKPAIVIALLLAASTGAQAEIYKCKVGNKLAFSDKPCPEGAAATTISVNVPKIGTDNAAVGGAADGMIRHRRAQEIAREIRDRQSNIYRLQQEMKAKISWLDAERRKANNNLAGATWLQNLSIQQQGIVSQFQTQISTEQASIDDLKRELAGLN